MMDKEQDVWKPQPEELEQHFFGIFFTNRDSLLLATLRYTILCALYTSALDIKS